MALITFLSLNSFSDFPVVDFTIPYLDKLVHIVFYFVATVLGCFFVRERTRGRANFLKTLFITGFFALIYGVIIELLQAFYTIDRSGELLDLAANSLGVIFALFTVKYLFSPKTGLNWKY